MKSSSIKISLFLFKLYLISLFILPIIKSAFALNEKLDIYQSPQSMGMGKAVSADAIGYAALFHNPANLANFNKKKLEVTPIDFEGVMGGGGFSTASGAQSLGIYRLFGPIKQNPGRYSYFNFSSVPSFTMRNFGVALIGSYQYAAQSNGTTADLNAHQDLGVLVGASHAFAGNLLRIGATAKFIERNELKGVYTHQELATYNDSTFPALFREGYGIGGDIGTTIVLPYKYLPTMAIVWHDVFGTRFTSNRLINKQASGKPDAIEQSFDTAFSIHPYFSNKLKSSIAIEYKHWEISSWNWKKHFHIGFQLEDEKTFYLWCGLNQLLPSLGFGLRVNGGTLEVGGYGEDVGDNTTSKSDIRFFFRYTIGY